MVEINHRERFLRVKILYYGPAAGGKTTNLQVLHRRAKAERRQDLVSVNTAQDRTILFDLLPLTTPAFRSHELRFQVVAVPGQRLYTATRKMLLKNADAIVFVANSARDRWQENLQSLKEMTEHLLSHGVDPAALPIVFQYNKRDLPDVTEIELMERGLNARKTDSIPSVAIREEGVLETFAAVLRRTMGELATRYQIGTDIRGARSAWEWTERTMKSTFGPPPEPREEPARATVVRVRPTSAPRAARSATVSAPAPDEPHRVESPAARAAGPVAAPPPPATASAPAGTSAAAEIQEPQAAQAMVESYAEAASSLADHISKLREDRSVETHRLEDLAAVADFNRAILRSAAAEGPALLKRLLETLARTAQTPQAALALVRPDGAIEMAVGYGLVVDPTEGTRTPEDRPVARAILEEGKPVLQLRGETGPLADAITRAGQDCVAAVVLPLVAARPLGLLAFYLPQEAPIPSPAGLEHLERVASGIALGLQAVSAAWGAERLERRLRAAFLGHVAEAALRGTEPSIENLEAVLGRIRSQPNLPEWLARETVPIENHILSLKMMRQSLLGLAAGQMPSRSATPVAAILEQIQNELGGPVSQAQVRFQVDVKPGLVPARAEPALLKGVISLLVESSRRSLSGLPSGGVIRILAQPENGRVRIVVFDNALALSPRDDPGRFFHWPLERLLSQTDLALARKAIEHFQGKLLVETREKVGTLRTIFLPTA